MQADSSFRFLEKILRYNADDICQFPGFVLKEMVSFAGADSGYIFTKEPGGKKYSCMITSMDAGNESHKTLQQSFDDIINDEAAGKELKEPLIINKSGSGTVPHSEKHLPGSNCLLPFYAGYGILVLSNLKENFEEESAANLANLIDLAWGVYERLLSEVHEKQLRIRAEGNEQLKNAYMVTVSHEVKTPVNAIVGFSNLLAEPGISPEIRNKYLKIILDSSEELLNTARDFAEISSLEQNLERTILQDINISNIVAEIIETFEPRARQKNLSIRSKIELKPDEQVIVTDENKLRQILNTLVSNSLKFSFSGNIEIGCRRDNGNFEFRVSDNGLGMSSSAQKNVFRYFSPGENILSGKAEGTGIGLALSHAYVRRLGGKIWFTSAEGEGTVFYFRLPYSSIAADDGPGKKADKVIESDANKQKVILVAEDDENNYFLISDLLKKQNYKIIHASNGKEAVEICRTTVIDLVFMDIKMPVMDGYTAARLIHEFNPGQKIVAQTAYEGDRNIAKQNGCIDFIAKPFTRQHLLSVIKAHI